MSTPVAVVARTRTISPWSSLSSTVAAVEGDWRRLSCEEAEESVTRA